MKTILFIATLIGGFACTALQADSQMDVAVVNLHETAVTQYVEANGAKYAYRTFGNKAGLPLILLQHFTGTMDNWDPEITNGFAKYFRVILFDNKGIGASGGRTPDNIEGMAQDARSFIKALGLKKVNLLGFSMGGFVAQQIALDDPGLINKVILAGTGPRGGQGIGGITKLLADSADMSPDDQKLFFFYRHTGSSRALGRQSLARINKRTAGRDPNASVLAIQSQLKAILRWAQPDASALSQLSRVEVPVLIVNGSADIVVPTVNSYVLFQNLPDARLCLYPDSAHGSIFQYPQLFLAEAIPFLKDADNRDNHLRAKDD
jgi:pimeloyl-ACP methyl ester carboxylesterase